MAPVHLIAPLEHLPRTGRLPCLHRAGVLVGKDYPVSRTADRLALSVLWQGHGWRDGHPIAGPCLLTIEPGTWFSLRPEGSWNEAYVVFAGRPAAVRAAAGIRHLPLISPVDATVASAWAAHLAGLLPRAEQPGVADMLDGLGLALVAAAGAAVRSIDSTRVSGSGLGIDPLSPGDDEAWLRSHLDLADAIGHLARAAGVSPATLRRRWQARHGCSPARWLERERHAQAEHLLRETDAPINRIAALCGWPDQRHFATAFRRRHGLSPGRWRSQHR